MTPDEIKNNLIQQYCDYQEIKQANEGHENKELDYKIKRTAAQLSAMGVSIEDLTL